MDWKLSQPLNKHHTMINKPIYKQTIVPFIYTFNSKFNSKFNKQQIAQICYIQEYNIVGLYVYIYGWNVRPVFHFFK